MAHHYFANSESWTAKIQRFDEDGSAYVYSNDITRGFDVLRCTATAPAQVDGGTWLNAAEMGPAPAYEMVMGSLVPLCASPNV